jgi:glycosyltransferase involved in cell wall biosynthesis
VIDIHEEPFSAVMRQVLGVVPAGTTTVGYAAQNLDKRYPPPFNGWERAAFSRLAGVYPCSRQAASVSLGRGYRGEIEVLPLGVDPKVFHPGAQKHDDDVFQLALIGRMVPEKGVRDAIAAFAEVRKQRQARLVLAGSGPELDRVPVYAAEFGVAGRIEVSQWLGGADVAELCRQSHVVLVPSVATSRWVEQFGRTIVEGQACGAVIAGYASGTIPAVMGGAGWLAAEGDTLGLSRAIARLASDERYWNTARDHGLTLAPSRTWQSVAAMQLELYRRATASGPRPVVRPTTAGRKIAADTFGPPARTADQQTRPFALPLLRDHPGLGRAAGLCVDLVTAARPSTIWGS